MLDWFWEASEGHFHATPAQIRAAHIFSRMNGWDKLDPKVRNPELVPISIDSLVTLMRLDAEGNDKKLAKAVAKARSDAFAEARVIPPPPPPAKTDTLLDWAMDHDCHWTPREGMTPFLIPLEPRPPSGYCDFGELAAAFAARDFDAVAQILEPLTLRQPPSKESAKAAPPSEIHPSPQGPCRSTKTGSPIAHVDTGFGVKDSPRSSAPTDPSDSSDSSDHSRANPMPPPSSKAPAVLSSLPPPSPAAPETVPSPPLTASGFPSPQKPSQTTANNCQPPQTAAQPPPRNPPSSRK
ncbi:MAG: hypothetical protein U0984_06850 [Prosthecobacter sp.]|nr:hypothetical protein [Prosthecobacter sp.]